MIGEGEISAFPYSSRREGVVVSPVGGGVSGLRPEPDPLARQRGRLDFGICIHI